jgi:hypothetical protein
MMEMMLMMRRSISKEEVDWRMLMLPLLAPNHPDHQIRILDFLLLLLILHLLCIIQVLLQSFLTMLYILHSLCSLSLVVLIDLEYLLQYGNQTGTKQHTDQISTGLLLLLQLFLHLLQLLNIEILHLLFL